MAWWKLFWNPVEEIAQNVEEVFEQSAFENVISEPVRSIVKAMISDRKRFIFQVDRVSHMHSSFRYSVLDIDTEEEFFVRSHSCPYDYRNSLRYSGPAWAKDYEVEWAVTTIYNHYTALMARAAKIKTARERNRLIEIYA